MGKIYVGAGDLKKLYFGEAKVKKIYIGTEILWQSTIPVQKPTELNVTRDYTGSELNNGYSTPTGVTMVGTNIATDGGIYTATYTPQEGYVWADDETQTPITVTMTIQYVWVKWDVNTTYVDNVTSYYAEPGSISGGYEYHQRTSSSNYYAYRCQSTGYSFNSETGKYSLIGGSVQKPYVYSGSEYVSLTGSGGFGSEGKHNDLSNLYGKIYEADNNAKWVLDCSAGMSGTNIYTKIRNQSTSYGGYAKIHEAVLTYIKGDTNLGTVNSTDINAYPQNGTPDNTYWYVKNW